MYKCDPNSNTYFIILADKNGPHKETNSSGNEFKDRRFDLNLKERLLQEKPFILCFSHLNIQNQGKIWRMSQKVLSLEEMPFVSGG